MKVSDFIATYIDALGVRHVMTLPGGNSMHLNDSVHHHGKLHPVYCLHESGAAIAATAYAQATGNAGACVVTAGPGVTNALTGCAAAYMEGVPVLFISGDSKVDDLDRRDEYGLRQAGQQDVPTTRLVRPITKRALEARAACDVPEMLEELMHYALSNRPGPVWLSVPLDVQAKEIYNTPIRLPKINKPHLDKQNVLQVKDLLARSQRPLLLLGAGIISAKARRDLMELVNFLGIPVMTTWAGLDLIAYDNPLFVGRPGSAGERGPNLLIQEADLLISIGARLALSTVGFEIGSFAKNAERVMVDIDPRELEKYNQFVDLLIRADAGDFIKQMTAHGTPEPRAEWLQHCQEVRSAHAFAGKGESYKVVEALSRESADDAVFANGVASYNSAIFYALFRNKPGQRVIAQHALGSMGCDIPNAIGAALGTGRSVVCLTGDGSFMQNIQELEVIEHLKLPISFYIANNRGYGCIARSQQRNFGRLSGADNESGLSISQVSGGALSRGYILSYNASDDEELPHVMTTFDKDGVPHSTPMEKV